MAVIIALGMITGSIEAKVGSYILTSICGGTAIAAVIKAKKSKEERLRKVDSETKLLIEKGKITVYPEDMLAIVGVLLAFIFSIAMIAGKFDTTTGSAIVLGICGGSAISAARGTQKKSN